MKFFTLFFTGVGVFVVLNFLAVVFIRGIVALWEDFK
jgi:Na+-transporting methylmalonyl-CoA/oxaloacetate decarboxylase gamma subunit